MRPRRRCIFAGAVLALLDAAYVGIFEIGVQRFADAHIPPNPSLLQSADAAVVFFEAFDGDSLSPGSNARADDATAVYRAGRVRELFVVGGRRHGRRPGSALIADRLTRAGIPADRIVVDSASFDSRTNWHEALRIARAHGADSLVLVSAAYHLERLSRVARSEGVTLAFYGRWKDRDSDGWGDRWLIAHREGMARAADALLPRAWYDALMRRWRR